MRFLAGLLAAVALALPAVAEPVDTGHLTAELVSAKPAIAPGETIHVALRQQIREGWHTYWRNAGDSGEPTRLAWTLAPGWQAGPFVWPTPQRLPVGPLMNYGYEGEVLLPLALTAPAIATPGETVTLTATAAFLVCQEICVPEEAVLSLPLRVAQTPVAPDPEWGPAIARTLAQAPKSAGLAAGFAVEPPGVDLAVAGSALRGADFAGAYFFPYESTLIDHARPQAIDRGPAGVTLTLAPGYGFQEGRAPAELSGVLALADGRAFEVTARRGAPPAGSGGLGAPAPAGDLLAVLAAAGLAFLGGLILNLMPCVFPVLAMKAASLAGHGGGAAAAARRQGLAFGAGVIATFLALAAVLLGLKAGGAAIGWGFQLQSPPVVAGLALLMLAVGLNLSGVFEAGTSLQGVGGAGVHGRSGVLGAFLTGVLAVLVAAPCTAPFMGGAVGWALTQPPAASLAVFAGLGLGFAAPFVAAAYAPGLLQRLPDPGPWMVTLRRLLAFPMYGAAGWLAWVLAQQAGAAALGRLLAAAVVAALAAWLWGLSQGSGRRLVRVLSAGLALTAAAVALWPEPAAAPLAEAPAGALPSEPYSPERLAALQAEGRAVFVNYTAAWCVSCQVNERVALSAGSVAQAVKRNGVAYLKADWTRKDQAIAAELATHGRAGVPLYLVYGRSGGEPEVLPSILTPGIVVRALDRAARPSVTP